MGQLRHRQTLIQLDFLKEKKNPNQIKKTNPIKTNLQSQNKLKKNGCRGYFRNRNYFDDVRNENFDDGGSRGRSARKTRAPTRRNAKQISTVQPRRKRHQKSPWRRGCGFDLLEGHQEVGRRHRFFALPPHLPLRVDGDVFVCRLQKDSSCRSEEQ